MLHRSFKCIKEKALLIGIVLFIIPSLAIAQVPGNFRSVCPPINSPGSNGTASGGVQTLTESITSFPTPKKGSTITLTLDVSGTADLSCGFDAENAKIFDENGNQIARINCSNNTTRTFTVKRSKFNSWAADGKITFSAEYSAATNFGDIEFDFSFDYQISYKTSSGSTGASFVINGPDTLFVNTQGTYRVRAFPSSLNTLYSKNWYVNGILVKLGGGQGNSYTSSFSNGDTLSVRYANCKGDVDTISKVIYTKQPTRCPKPNFVADRNTVAVAQSVKLNEISKFGATDWEWDITRENPAPFPQVVQYFNRNADTGQNPEVAFLAPGSYEVCLTAFNSVCPGGDSLCKPSYIRVLEDENICSPSADPLSDSVGFLVDNGGINGSYNQVQGGACDVSIQPCANKIELTFEELDLKDNEGFLKIYDGVSDDGKKLWDVQKYGVRGITGDLSSLGNKTLTANTGNVYVEFSTGANPNGEGFKIKWEAKGDTLPPINASIKGDSLNCVDFSAQFKADVNAADVSYEWYIDSSFQQDPQGSRELFIYDSFNSSRNDTVGLVVNSCGRSDTAVKPVSAFTPSQPPKVGFTVSATFGQPGVVISLTDTSKPCIDSRDWTISPNTFEYVNNTGRKNKSPDVKFNESGSYTITLVDSNAGGGAKVTKFGVIRVTNYCEPTVRAPKFDVGMNLVQFGTLSNDTRIGNNEYNNYNQSVEAPEVAKGGSYTFEIARDQSANSVNYKAWIDFNINGKFDSNEVVVNSGIVNGNQYQEQVRIGRNVPTGTYQMRVGAEFSYLPNDPCGSAFGEYEDYTIQVVNDQTKPDIIVNGPDTIGIEACSPTKQLNAIAYAEDNVDGRVNDITINGSVDTALPGLYNITYTYTDTAGNTGTEDRVVRVETENQKPDFSLKGDKMDTIVVSGNYTDPGTTVPTDGCTGIDSFYSNNLIDRSTLSRDSIVYVARDNSGNVLKRTRYLTLVDTTSPTFVLAGGKVITIPVNEPYNDQGIDQVSDNFYDPGQLMRNINNPVNVGVPGTYTVTYKVSDGSGNTTMKTREVTVKDQSAPQLNVLADTVKLPVFQQLKFSEAVSVKDNFSEPKLSDRLGNFFRLFPSGAPQEIGFYDVGLEYEDDAGNKDTANFVVHVVDETAPDISLKGPIYVDFERFTESPYASSDSVNVSDNYYRSFQIEVDTSGTYFTRYLDTFPTGVFEIQYRAIDSSGNVSEPVTRILEAVSPTTGIEQESSKKSGLDVYPNPVDREIQVEVNLPSAKPYTISLVNMLGKRVEMLTQHEGKQVEHTFNLGDIAQGSYVLKLRTPDRVINQSIVVQ